MKKLFAVAALVAAVVVAPAALAGPVGAVAPAGAPTSLTKYCPGTLLASVTLDVRNDADAGLLGGLWARDDYRLGVTIYRVAKDTYCASTQYTGGFTALGGVSPGALGTVATGRSGRISGAHRSTYFTARWRPSKATSGYVGAYDYRCNGIGACPGRVDWLGFYFTDVRGYALAWWHFIYDGGEYGLWVHRSYGSSGDVSG
jgi:hypothetical protein